MLSAQAQSLWTHWAEDDTALNNDPDLYNTITRENAKNELRKLDVASLIWKIEAKSRTRWKLFQWIGYRAGRPNCCRTLHYRVGCYQVMLPRPEWNLSRWSLQPTSSMQPPLKEADGHLDTASGTAPAAEAGLDGRLSRDAGCATSETAGQN